ncbi:hypothetical protein [Nonomuraea sp. NEAU-A123]|uniref:hypothetical protein n=1 Tax=Nonomuraea sp. NEAU-A123 TaxID=2839649 RepID=UPI001BE3D38C|nr:hypothetical protein [Nonomuraea sp. NEAU-A123]MBT2230526.1 hypothetical protein [Nonomuraea sp. NEAU-A123]
MIRVLRVLLLVAVLTLAGAAPAAAHNVTAGADLRIAQTIAGAELTIVIKGTTRVPGPLRIGVIAFGPVTDLPVGLEVRSVADGRTVTGVARAARDPQYVQLKVDATGPHELTLRAGNEVAVLPFRVLVDRGSAGELLIYGGLLVAALLLVGGLLTGALARPGPAMLLAGGAAVGLTVAAMVVVFEPMLPAAPPDGAAPTVAATAGTTVGAAAGAQTGGRPFTQGRVATVPARPASGAEFTLRFDLIDGSTGRPVDDLVLHHEALAHVVVTSEDGRFFRHVHPLRTAPGRLEVRMRTDRPGRYLAYAELEREDSGGQLVTGSFNVGDPVASDTSVPSDAAETPVEAAAPLLRPAAPVAGRPTTIELGTSGTVRPWLGMTGHLIVRSQDGTFLGHIHEMGSPGPRLSFTFSFPSAGRYFAWAQYATTDRIVTMPFTVDVTASGSPS